MAIEINGADESTVGPIRDALKAAPKESPAFTGTPTAPTPAPGTDSTVLATAAFVQAAIASLVDSSPGALDTLNELAAALGDDENFAATVTAALALKAPLDSPVLTGTPTAPTPAEDDNSTKIATTAFVQTEIAGLGGGGGVTAFTGLSDAPSSYSGQGGKFVAVTAGADGLEFVDAPSGGGGGLTNFTESVNTSSPNATVPVVAITATNAASNVDVALVPKGTGAIAANVSDGTSAGGNKRGARSVDFQANRSNASEVASGSFAVLSGGYANKSSGLQSTVGGGRENTASGTSSTISGGDDNQATQSNATVSGGSNNVASGSSSAISGGSNNQASGGYSIIASGYLNQASGSFSAIFGGSSNTASGSYSMISGGQHNSASEEKSSVVGGERNIASGPYSLASGFYAGTRGIYGASARASGRFTIGGTTPGDAQRVLYILRRATSDAAQTELSCDGGSPAVGTRIALPDQSTYSFRGQVVARASGGATKAWRFEGTIKRGANAAATALVGSVEVTSTDEEAGASGWALAVTADTTSGSLAIKGTGEAATDIRWLATVETCELVF